MIEHQLALILATTRTSDSNSLKEIACVAADCRTKPLEKLINELGQSPHPVFKGKFIELLNAYGKNRNMLVHNLILTKNIHAKFQNDRNALKMFIPEFDSLLESLTKILAMATRDKFAGSIVADEPQKSSYDPEKLKLFEVTNTVFRYFMTEKWNARNINKEIKPSNKPQI